VTDDDKEQVKADLQLLKKAEAVLAEIDRNAGLIDRHADVLAALRIRLEGGPRKSLEELMTAAGEIRGKKDELAARLKAAESKKKDDLGDLLAREPKKTKSLDDLLGS
jgi:predicted  nucleic acid-binding Zn-ribbon protein